MLPVYLQMFIDGFKTKVIDDIGTCMKGIEPNTTLKALQEILVNKINE